MLPPEQYDKELAAKNTRLAVLLGLVSFSIYAGYILAYYF
jgi:hypothetical protein